MGSFPEVLFQGCYPQEAFASITYSPPSTPWLPAPWNYFLILQRTTSSHCLCTSCGVSWRIAVALFSMIGPDRWDPSAFFSDPLDRWGSSKGSDCRFGLGVGYLCPLRFRGRSTVVTGNSVVAIVCVGAFSVFCSSGNGDSASETAHVIVFLGVSGLWEVAIAGDFVSQLSWDWR